MYYCMKARCTAEASPSDRRLSENLQCMIKVDNNKFHASSMYGVQTQDDFQDCI